MGRENIFPWEFPSPLLQPTLLLYPVSPLLSSLAPFSYLSNFVNPPVITSMSLLFRVTYLGQRLFVYVPALFLSIVQYHICQTAIPFSFPIVSTTCAGWAYSTDTYLLSHIQLVSAPLLSIHSSVPHLPDSDSIFVLHSLYHMCKLGLFH